jgi:hypothetical protein
MYGRRSRPTATFELSTSADEAVVLADPASTRRLDSYMDIDVRLARKFSFRDRSSLTAFFEISNALNRRNECCIEFEIDAESEEPALVLESIRSLPLLPSLGVIWRF